MIDWDKLRVFHSVARHRNITHAATELGVNQSSISRQITALEEQMGVPLFHRRPRGLLLSEQGEILLGTVNDFFQKLSLTENTLLELNERPTGELKVSVPIAFGTVWLVPAMQEFIKLYREVRLSLIVDDREVDLSMREADIAIRFYPSKHPDLIQRPLFSVKSSLYASNDYLRQRGMPRNLAALEQHDLIAYNEGHQPPYKDINWLFTMAEKKGVRLNPVISINSLYGMLRAVKSGMGIASLPDYMVQRAKRVSVILPTLEGPTVDAYLVYPIDLRESKRVRAFHNFIGRKLVESGF